jgi:protein-disulfide isomerase
MPEDHLRADLIHAIALELTQLGYRTSARPGYLQREDTDSLKLVSADVWRGVARILGARQGARSILQPDETVDHISGAASARVTVIEYGDFECPHCHQAHAALKVMLPHFGDAVRFVYRHFPLREIHPYAELAAEAAETVGAQDKFWPMHDRLFEDQLHLDERQVLDCASRVGADLPRYLEEMNDHVYRQRVQGDMKGALQLGVRSTPAFFVNGSFADVSFGLQHLHEAIDRALLAT